jgi:alpha-N-arabinofuranosidase
MKRSYCTLLLIFAATWLFSLEASAAEHHVAVAGNDAAEGSAEKPLKTIQRAAELAQPGDTITVHQGVYREQINPPRGGESDLRRIVYRAAPGEKVEIKGSEAIKGWTKVQDGVWKVELPNAMFGNFNPYANEIRGDWFDPKGRKHHTGAVYLDGQWLPEAAALDDVLKPKPAEAAAKWFGQVDDKNTTLWARFGNADPNQRLVEINVRQTVFYPRKPGMNYITVRGFAMRHAATPWSPPTTEQIGLIGTNWSKGWIIENNEISHSRCTGITLGKYHDPQDSRPSESAEGYEDTIRRALANGWDREHVGHHVVRNNVIHDCEQAGICGSMGGAFSRITGNHIYNILRQRLFGGAEMGGIKLHAAIDVLIQNNRIHDTDRGIWLDWMAQGTRVSGNLCYRNDSEDLFVEVDHGPMLIDNNVLLSEISLRDNSQGAAYIHNLMSGIITSYPDARQTPFHKPHSTALAGREKIHGGDNRFFNNIFIGVGKATAPSYPPNWTKHHRVNGYGLWVYDRRDWPLLTGGNVYLNGARPYAKELQPVVADEFDPHVKLVEEGPDVYLQLELGDYARQAKTLLVTTVLLGKTKVAGLPYENPDGTPLKLDTDYFGRPRDAEKPLPGPFENAVPGLLKLKVWDNHSVPAASDST